MALACPLAGHSRTTARRDVVGPTALHSEATLKDEASLAAARIDASRLHLPAQSACLRGVHYHSSAQDGAQRPKRSRHVRPSRVHFTSATAVCVVDAAGRIVWRGWWIRIPRHCLGLCSTG